MAEAAQAHIDRAIVYPERDGLPMAETDLHRRELNNAIESVTDLFRNEPHVYVAGNLLLYYEEGNPQASVAPDLMVVLGVSKGDRRTYKLWEEGHAPTFVLEVTSRSTRLEDQGSKRALYAMLGVSEYFLFDPEGDYLHPKLQGYALGGNEYARIEQAQDGCVRSRTLGLVLAVEGKRLLLADAMTGERLLTPAEAQEGRRVEQEGRRAEEEARKAAEERVRQLEAEIALLRPQR